VNARSYEVISRPFAGRVGGNQHFALTPDTPAKAALLKEIPDAAPYLTWRESFDLQPFLAPELWKQALVEMYATAIFVFLNGWVEIMNLNTATALGGNALTELAANIIGETELVLSIALLVYATAPVSGGHLNPMISIATFLARLTSFPRLVLYVLAQCIGGRVGAFLIRASYGRKLPEQVGGVRG
jgi:hypothetical protein